MVIARSAIGAPDLEAGLRRACHVVCLLQDDMALTVEHEGALVGPTVRLPGPRERPRFLHEYMIRTIWRLAAWMAGGSLKVQRFDFAFEEPPYVKQYAKVFPAPTGRTARFQPGGLRVEATPHPVLARGASLARAQ